MAGTEPPAGQSPVKLVDFDNTLQINGQPNEPMVQQVRQWLQDGNQVHIFTASVEGHPERRAEIDKWTREQFGAPLPITDRKLPGADMVDDRSQTPEVATGQVHEIPANYPPATPPGTPQFNPGDPRPQWDGREHTMDFQNRLAAWQDAQLRPRNAPEAPQGAAVSPEPQIAPKPPAPAAGKVLYGRLLKGNLSGKATADFRGLSQDARMRGWKIGVWRDGELLGEVPATAKDPMAEIIKPAAPPLAPAAAPATARVDASAAYPAKPRISGIDGNPTTVFTTEHELEF